MPLQTRSVTPGPDANSVRTANGEVLRPPADWILLPPGDATLTRRIKAATPTWTVQIKKGRKVFSQGLWAAAEIIQTIRNDLTQERATPAYAKKQAASLQRREREQADYVAEFRQAVLEYLAFAPQHADLASRLAEAVTTHATPVGSGTVARTERIPLPRRAEAAVIAWLRHRTTAYDQMSVPRVKGSRRELRRRLAQQSTSLLAQYRRSGEVEQGRCVLAKALEMIDGNTEDKE